MACPTPMTAVHPTGGRSRTTPAEHELTVHSRDQSCPPRKRPTNERHMCAPASNDLPGATTRGPMATLCTVGTAVEDGDERPHRGSRWARADRPSWTEGRRPFDPLPPIEDAHDHGKLPNGIRGDQTARPGAAEDGRRHRADRRRLAARRSTAGPEPAP